MARKKARSAKKKTTRRSSTTRKVAHVTRSNSATIRRLAQEARDEENTERRERYYRAKRAVRSIKRMVLFPKAVIHTKQMHYPAMLMEEIPEQALIEHWEAIGELKDKGIEVRHTEASQTIPHLLREIELDAPISAHARQFASRHGLIVRERRSPIRTTLERVFG